MTDIHPDPDGSRDRDSGDKAHDRDSLQEQARKESSEAESEEAGDRPDRPIPLPPIANPD